MTRWPSPSEHNHYLDHYIAVLLRSFTHWTGRLLLDPGLRVTDPARYIFYAPFVLVSHDADPDPLFTYGNQTALTLFEMTWEEFTAMPSRQSAEPLHQAERERILTTVAQQGYLEDYQGVRVTKSGRRFLLQEVTLWNLIDASQRYCGQAALGKHWTFLE
jgi:hypothetical protein